MTYNIEANRALWERLSHEELYRLFQDFRLKSLRPKVDKSVMVKLLLEMQIEPFSYFPPLMMEFDQSPASFVCAPPYVFVAANCAGGLTRVTAGATSNAVHLLNTAVDYILYNARKKIIFFVTHEDGAIHGTDIQTMMRVDSVIKRAEVTTFRQFRAPEKLAYDAVSHALIVKEMPNEEAFDEVDQGDLFHLDILSGLKSHITLDGHTLLGINGLVVDHTGILYIADATQRVVLGFKRQQHPSSPSSSSKKPRMAPDVKESKASFKPGIVGYECVVKIGNGSGVSLDGDCSRCSFTSPGFMTVDGRNNIYILDMDNTIIRKFNARCKQLQTILVDWSQPLRLPKHGLHMAITENYSILVLDDVGCLKEYVPYDDHLVYAFVRFRQAMRQVDTVPDDIALMLLDFWLPPQHITYEFTYPRKAFLNMADIMEIKMGIADKMSVYHAKERMKDGGFYTNSATAAMKLLRTCDCEKKDHQRPLPAQELKKENVKSQDIIRREWQLHTPLFREQCVEYWEALERSDMELLLLWMSKHHADVCCERRHLNKQAMLSFPKLEPGEIDSIMADVIARRPRPVAIKQLDQTYQKKLKRVMQSNSYTARIQTVVDARKKKKQREETEKRAKVDRQTRELARLR